MRSLQITEFGGPLVWSRKPVPVPVGPQVLFETVACGVCHSDLHIWEGHYEIGSGRRSYVKDRGVRLPLTLGHEVVGRVVAVGPEVVGLKLGEVRLIYPWIGCGSCKQCRRGRQNLCPTPRSLGVFDQGGYSDHILVPDFRFTLDFAPLPPESACSYACAGLTAFGALRKALPLDSDDTLVLIGAGGLGLMALQVVRELTSARVVVIDLSEEKLAAARAMADSETIDASRDDAIDEARRMTGREGVDAVIDFVGTSDTARLGFSLLAKSGILVIVGLFGGELALPLPTIALRNISVRGSYTGSFEELRELMDIARAGRLTPLPVTRYPLTEAQNLLERLRDGGILGRAVLVPEAETRY